MFIHTVLQHLSLHALKGHEASQWYLDALKTAEHFRMDTIADYVNATFKPEIDGYLKLYEQDRSEIQHLHHGATPDYPEAVASAWSLSRTIGEQSNPAAAELLRLWAFLAPEAIPDEMVTQGARGPGSSAWTSGGSSCCSIVRQIVKPISPHVRSIAFFSKSCSMRWMSRPNDFGQKGLFVLLPFRLCPGLFSTRMYETVCNSWNNGK